MSNDDTTFNGIVALIKPRLSFHVRAHEHKIKGFTADDIRQELLIELWTKLPDFPPDIQLFTPGETRISYRFTRYLDTIFNRRIIDLYRINLIKKGNQRTAELRDAYHRSIFVGESIEIFER